MSLFERIQNKRYDLQESGPNKPKFYNPNTEKKFQGSVEGKQLKKGRNVKKKTTPSLTRGSGIEPTERINPDDTKTQKTQQKIADKRIETAKKSGKIDDFTNKPIQDAPDTKKLVRGKKGETIANPIKPTKKTKSKTSGTTQLKGVKDTELNPKTTGDEGQFRRNAKRRKITGDVMPKKDLPKPTKTVGVNQADVSKKAKEFAKKIEKKRVKKLAPIDLKKPTKRVDLRKVERKISRKRPSNAPSLADINKKIDAKNPVEAGKPVKGSVLRVLKKGEVASKSVMQQNVPKGFERVLKKDPKAQEIIKKQVKTAQLVDPKPIKPKSSTIKPNLFGRIKNFVKGEPKIPSDYKLVRGTADQPLSVTRKVYKGKLGAVRKFVDKLPRKYKLAGTALLATAAIAPNIKNPFAPKPEKKSYTVASKKLKLDTGKKNT